MTLVLVGVAFLAMEPVTYLTHRFVMHGFGWRLHRSHHRVGAPGWEANDWYPVVFASAVCAAMAVGFNVPRLSALVPVTVGVTLYGLAYALVHDVCVHHRLPLFRAGAKPLARLTDAHALHHRFNGEPYGMLLPIVPAALRQRAANGSAPSHDPADA